MISVVRWVGRGRLAERPQQYEMAADDMEALVAKQQSMALDGKLDGDDIGKQFDDSDDTDDEEDDMDGLERMGRHITLHAGGEDDTEEAAEGGDGERKDGDETNGMNGHAAEDDEAMGEDEDKRDTDGAPKASSAADSVDDDPKAAALLDELQMDEYDNEPEGAELFLGGRRLTVHDSNADDPYITVADDEDEDSDEEDVIIKPTDCVLCVGRTEDEHSAVEVYVYDEDKGSLFVHHDFQIPAFPLAFAQLNQGPGSAEVGSYLAVGSFLPGIEVWNLNVMDVLEPACTLGGYEDERVNVVGRKAKDRKLKEGSHEDAVLCLDWHAAHRERLVSGSADETVKLWDVTTQQCTATLTHHRDSRDSSGSIKSSKKDKGKKSKKSKSKAEAAGDDDDSWYDEAQHANLSHKVQSLHINPSEPSLLLTGAYDRTVHLVDMRTAGSGTAAQRVYRVESDVETVRWHGRAPLFLVATETGMVYLFDARRAEQPLFRLAAHSSATTAAQFSPHVDGLFLTSSADKTVKLWSVEGGAAGDSGAVLPSLLASKEMRVGSVWSASWDVDVAALLACGGDKGKVAVWDIRENADVVRKYGKQLGEQQADTVEPSRTSHKQRGERDEDRTEVEEKASVSRGKRESAAKQSRRKS